MRDARAFLQRARDINRELKRYRSLLAEATARKFLFGSVNLGERVQTSPEPDRMGQAEAVIGEYVEELNKRIAELSAAQLEIERAIRGLDDATSRAVLSYRYIACLDWDSVCREMGKEKDGEWVPKDKRYIFRLHQKAINDFQKIIDDH